MSSRISNEQPMSKRQRIEAAADANKRNGNVHTFDAISHNSDKPNQTIENCTPPDILPISHSHSNTNHTSNATITTTMSDSTTQLTSDELDNSAAGILHCDFSESTTLPIADQRIVEYPDLLKTSNVPMAVRSNESVPGINGPIAGTSSQQSNVNHSQNNCFRPTNPSIAFNSSISISISNNSTETLIRFNDIDSNNYPSPSNAIEMTRHRQIDVDQFQLHLMKECLCGIDERSLRRTFAAHCYKDAINGTKHPLPLDQWPSHKLIQFLSNIEFLFEIYLNQNAKGEICTRIMHVCDLLLTNDRNNIIDDIFLLSEHEHPFVQYLAIKVLANCILIAKDKEEYCQSLLTTLMSNLNVRPGETTHLSLRKISFILGVILHIMEWKDIKKHPRDDQIVINGREIYNDSDNENFTLPIEMPTIENNYFAVQHAPEMTNVATNPSAFASSDRSNHFDQTNSNNSGNFVHEEEEQMQHHLNTSHRGNESRANSCHLQYLSDSESFDSKDLKYSITDLLGHKWSLLVDKMAHCITLLQNNRDLHYIENTVITFLTLWERIINVDTCISFDSTLPFHEKLTRFEEILIRGKLPIPIYKQILTLFSASLCYTTTLALQPEVPTETNALATEIFNSVKSTRIFSSLPTSDSKIQNDIGFIGYRYSTVVYGMPSNHSNHTSNESTPAADTNPDTDDSLFAMEKSIDFILLQKLVLLILKAIVVTVRPIRSGDSSDSSMDSCSSNSSNADQEQDNILVERATRDVFSKLKKFLKNKLNQHPETHLTKVIVHLFSNQDEYLIEAMLCMLGTTITFLPRQMPFGTVNRATGTTNQPNRNQFIELIKMICPVYTFLEFLEIIKFDKRIMLELLISDDTCFLLYFLRFLKYIRSDWAMFRERCNDWLSSSNTMRFTNRANSEPVLQRVMDVLIRLRLKLERLVLRRVFPYDISPLLSIMHQCERLHEGNEHELF